MEIHYSNVVSRKPILRSLLFFDLSLVTPLENNFVSTFFTQVIAPSEEISRIGGLFRRRDCESFLQGCDFSALFHHFSLWTDQGRVNIMILSSFSIIILWHIMPVSYGVLLFFDTLMLVSFSIIIRYFIDALSENDKGIQLADNDRQVPIQRSVT